MWANKSSNQGTFLFQGITVVLTGLNEPLVWSFALEMVKVNARVLGCSDV